MLFLCLLLSCLHLILLQIVSISESPHFVSGQVPLYLISLCLISLDSSPWEPAPFKVTIKILCLLSVAKPALKGDQIVNKYAITICFVLVIEKPDHLKDGFSQRDYKKESIVLKQSLNPHHFLISLPPLPSCAIYKPI